MEGLGLSKLTFTYQICLLIYYIFGSFAHAFNTYSSYLYWVWGSMLGVRDMALNYTITLLHLLCVIRIKPCFLFSLPEAQPKLPSSLAWFIPIASYLIAAHFSTLAWKIPWTEEPGRLQSMGSLRVGHDWATSLSFFTFMHWRRKWQPTSVFLPGESQGQGSLVGCCLWGRTESDTTEAT